MAEVSHQVFINADIYTPVGAKAAKGEQMGILLHIPNGQIETADGIITYVGEQREAPHCDFIHDLGGCALLPGFIDPHSHIPFAGTRSDEFAWRLRGDSYMSIMQRGGGIVNTMKAVREMPEQDLLLHTQGYLQAYARQGFTTLECKSGYGLDRENELKQLRVIKENNRHRELLEIETIGTYLGAHALPPEYKGRQEAYVDFMIAEMLPEIKEKGLADFCDVFCEKGVFSIEDSRRLLTAAKDLGFKLKVHADEITYTGGAELAAELGATSADHLLHVADSGIKALAGSDTVAVLLPLTAFTLNEPYAPARKLIESGCAVALGTDFNPGSCFTYSAPLIFALACIHMGMTVEEAITALTLNAAAAIGMEEKIGSIEVGKQADFVLLNTPNINDLVYYTGLNILKATYKLGRQINPDLRNI